MSVERLSPPPRFEISRRVGAPLVRVLASGLVVVAHLALAAMRAEAAPDESPPSSAELKRLSLEELFDVEVTLVSKRPQKLSETASAIQVITGEDIRRSGAMTIADALRLVPNAEVQQINAFAWVVSTRGFDVLFANKLLVMIDGRTIYTPLDAGVFWDAQQIMLEDVDRIEVISGPGGSLWGANAVNGVINIVTKSAKETQGVYMSGAGGSFLRGEGAVRLGGSLGRSTFYRVYARRADWNANPLPNGDDAMTAWNMTRSGFRVDSYGDDAITFTVQGDGYAGVEYNAPNDKSTLDGQHLLGRLTRPLGPASALDLQVYADRTWRRDVPSTVSDQMETYDVDLQHRFPVGERHDVLWGLGHRLMVDNTPTSTIFVGFLPTRRYMRLYSAFAQDEVTVVPNRFKVTLGAKLEHQTFSDFELQPSLRLAWTPTARQTLWSAVSRAVRSPSRIDVDYFIPTTPPFGIAGGPDFHSEQVIAYEAGYRVQPVPRMTFGFATFYNHYDDLYSVEPQSSASVFPYTIQNGIGGDSWGAEISGAVQMASAWRIRGGYTYFEKHLWSQPGHNATADVIASLGNDPRNQVVLQSMIDVGTYGRFDAVVRYVDALPNPAVDSYIAIDVRLAFESARWEVAVVGQGLTEKTHVEYNPFQEIPRSVYGKISSRW